MSTVIWIAAVAGYLAVGARVLTPHAERQWRRDIDAARRCYPLTFASEGVAGVDHLGTWVLVTVGVFVWPLALIVLPVIRRCSEVDRDYVETIRDANEVRP